MKLFSQNETSFDPISHDPKLKKSSRLNSSVSGYL